MMIGCRWSGCWQDRRPTTIHHRQRTAVMLADAARIATIAMSSKQSAATRGGQCQSGQCRQQDHPFHVTRLPKKSQLVIAVYAVFSREKHVQVLRVSALPVVISERPQPYTAVVERQMFVEFFLLVSDEIPRFPRMSARVIV